MICEHYVEERIENEYSVAKEYRDKVVTDCHRSLNGLNKDQLKQKALSTTVPAAAETAGPAAAWTVHVQKEKGGAWQEFTRSLPFEDEEQASAWAREVCKPGIIGPPFPGLAGYAGNYAGRFVSPSGEETVIQCEPPAGPSVRAPAEGVEGRAFIETGCEHDLMTGMFVDCGCAADMLRAMPPEPPTAAGEKSPIVRAAEACPADKAHIEREFYVPCLAQFEPQAENRRIDADTVCRCMAANVASKYLADPIFNVRHIERLRGEATRACLARGSG